MGESAPAFSFYAKEFLAGTLTMSLAARGAYITLLAYQWDHGSIPNDSLARQRILSCTKREADALWLDVQGKFHCGEDDSWRNARLEVERNKQASRRSALSANGQKGGRPKKLDESNSFQNAKATENQKKSLPFSFAKDPPVSPPSEFRTALEPAESMHWFDRVYGAYPNKDRKQAAHDVWRELGPDLGMAEGILADIQRRVTHGWVKFERRFIPQLMRYLRERQWEDADSGATGVLDEDDPQSRIPHAWQCQCGEIHEGTQAEFKARKCLKVAG